MVQSEVKRASAGRRQFLKSAAAGAAVLGVPMTAAQAQSGGAVRIVVSYPAGGGADLMARLLAPRMAEALGQPVTVENMPGDSGQLAAAHVAKSAPDGRTLLLDASSFSVNPSLFPKLPYDSDSAFVPVAVLAVFPNVLVCHPSFKAQSVAELLKMVQAEPGKVAYASSGVGSAQHLAGALFEDLTKTELHHVPYKGGGPAMADVVAGKVPLFFGNVASTREHIQAQRLRPLAVTTRRRVKALPQVPSMADSGIRGYEVLEWNPLLAPARLPQAERSRLLLAVRKALADHELGARVQAMGGEVFPNDPDGLAAGFIKTQQVQWRRVITARNIKLS